MLTPEQIDDRMAELGRLLWERLVYFANDQPDKMRVWERMKDVAEQAKRNAK